MSIMGSLRESVRDSIRDSHIGMDNFDSIIDIRRRLANKDDVLDNDMT